VVESQPSKLLVAGSIPVSRSKFGENWQACQGMPTAGVASCLQKGNPKDSKVKECHYYRPSDPEVQARLIAERLLGGGGDGVYVIRSKGKVVSCQSSLYSSLAWIRARDPELHHSIEYRPT
jgi:hypothetical protein